MLNKNVLTTGEVADILRVHQTTVIDWVDKRILPSYKTPGGHRRVGKDELLKFMSDRKMPLPRDLAESPTSSPTYDKHHGHVHEGFRDRPKFVQKKK